MGEKIESDYKYLVDIEKYFTSKNLVFPITAL